MRRRGLLVAAVTVVLLLLTALPVSAEWFLDLYFGGAFTAENDLTSRFGTTLQILEDVEYDASVLLGGRLGYWFEQPLYDRLSLGVAVDVFRFQSDIDSQTVFGSQTVAGVASTGDFVVFPIDISVVAVGLDLMLRWPVLQSPEFPRGRLYPYFTIGPAIFFSKAEDTANFAPENQSDSDTTLGFKMGFGAVWYLTRYLAAFGEWRFTYFSPEWNFNDNGVSGKLETDLATVYFLVGLSLRF